MLKLKVEIIFQMYMFSRVFLEKVVEYQKRLAMVEVLSVTFPRNAT